MYPCPAISRKVGCSYPDRDDISSIALVSRGAKLYFQYIDVHTYLTCCQSNNCIASGWSPMLVLD